MCHPAGTSGDYPEEIQRVYNNKITCYAVFSFQYYFTVLLYLYAKNTIREYHTKRSS